MSYVPKQATPARFYQVFDVTPSETGYLIPKGLKVKTEASTVEPQITYEVEADYFMPANVTGLEKDAQGEYLYRVPIVQGATVTREILGTSDGTAGQEFQLGYEPVVLDTLYLEVYTNGQYIRWNKVDNFLNSTSSDKHFTTSVDEYDVVTVKFGDGVNGQIPNSYENGIVATYRVGGGSFGNVGANKIVVLNTSVKGVNKTFNPYDAYEKGSDRETLEELKRNIPASVRTLDRAVTLSDFEYLTLKTNKVLSCKALRTDDLGVTVYVVPKEPVLSDGSIQLDDELKDFLDDYVKEKTMVGVTCEAVSAKARVVDVKVKYRPTSMVYDTQVQDSIKNIIHALLDLGNKSVGEELIISDLVTELTNASTGVPYLRSVLIEAPNGDILLGDTSTSNTMTADEVIVLGGLTLEVF